MSILVRAVIFLYIYYEFLHKLMQTCFLFKYMSLCNFSKPIKYHVVSYGFARCRILGKASAQLAALLSGQRNMKIMRNQVIKLFRLKLTLHS